MSAPGARTRQHPPVAGEAPAAVDGRDVTVELGGRAVVDGVTLHVGPGGWVCVVGPNGAGKTTLLRAVAGLVPVTGSLTVGGRTVGALAARARARLVALVPQAPVVPPAMTVADYVLLGRTAHIAPFGVESAADLAVVGAVLGDLGLGGLADRAMGTLSGGERQRAVLARALAQEAPVLLLDEPTTALDVGRQQEVLELVEDLRASRGLTVLSTMHDLTLAGQYAPTVALLVAGRLVSCGRPADVLTEEAVARHYGARVRVLHDERGGPLVVPARPDPAGPRGGKS